MGPVRAAVLIDMMYNMGELDDWPNLRKAIANGNY
jgi:hypothetical protein